jgi:hypothetical protein
MHADRLEMEWRRSCHVLEAMKAAVGPKLTVLRVDAA